MAKIEDVFLEVQKQSKEMVCYGHKTKPEFSLNSETKKIEFPKCCSEFDKRRSDLIESTINDLGRTIQFNS